MARPTAAMRRFLADTGAKVPVICGPMYPGSNPELVAAVSDAGGFGVVQPISLTHLYGHDFRAGLRLIRSLTPAPFGVNFTIVPNKRYMRQIDEWVDIAIDEGVKFFLTSLGKPDAIVRTAERCAPTACPSSPPLVVCLASPALSSVRLLLLPVSLPRASHHPALLDLQAWYRRLP